MAVDTYKTALALVLAHEGGFSDNPKDPGGATMKGVTQGTYDAYRKNKGLPVRTVKKITTPELQDIYRNQYWDMIQADRLPAGLDYAIFDFAVNSGPEQAVKTFQRLVGAAVDGQSGEETIRLACANMNKSEAGTILAYCDARMKFLKSLKTFKTFGSGWTRRVQGDKIGAQIGDIGVVDYATKIAADDLAYPIPTKQLPTAIGVKEGEIAGKGLPGDVAVTKTTTGKSIIAAGTGMATVATTTVANIANQLSPAADSASKAATATTAVATKAIGAAGHVKEAGHALFGIFSPELLIFILSGGLLLSFVGLGAFTWHFVKTQREKSA